MGHNLTLTSLVRNEDEVSQLELQYDPYVTLAFVAGSLYQSRESCKIYRGRLNRHQLLIDFTKTLEGFFQVLFTFFDYQLMFC